MLGDNIKRLMRKKGYTQKQLALCSKCTTPQISWYINNKHEPRISVLNRIAVALGVNIDELVKGGEQE